MLPLNSVLVPELHTLDIVTHPSRIDTGILMSMVASRSRPNLGIGLVSPLRSISVRQGYIWSDSFKESKTHFIRPVVALEPVMLTNSELEELSRSTNPDMGSPDSSLMDENEIAFWKGGLQFNINHADQGPSVRLEEGNKGVVEKVKDRILNSLWWGGSIALPDLSFVRLVSGLL